MDLLIWIGIALCISQSAMFSGLNLGFFSISKLRLEIEASQRNRHAENILELRKDSNFLLTTILWGNVGINVLLTLLSNSVLVGLYAFMFSTIVITFLGEIVPQAYFSRNAMRAASWLSPVIRLYQLILYPVAKPTALVLDKWLGPEGIQFFNEKDLRELLSLHIKAPETDIGRLEGTGALNFLAIDDLPIKGEGEATNPKSILEMPFEGGRLVFPSITPSPTDQFLRKVEASGEKWVVCVHEGRPGVVINADSLIRRALFGKRPFNPYLYCHRPIIIENPNEPLRQVLMQLKVHPERAGDDVIDQDIVLLWGPTKKIITGSDVLGRLLRGIVQQSKKRYWVEKRLA